MIKNNRLCYESGEDIKEGEHLSVVAPNGNSFILKYGEQVVGMSIQVNEKGEQQQVPQVMKGWFTLQGHPINLNEIADCKIYYVIDVEGKEIINAKDDEVEVL